ncbi:hypothetical protein L249_0715 [Ophiocordyceps polyrhachis-furcata BCC 54312]|uniref:Uncharacterized protein n=1 Tax=Ophiocordyceps polyrhachis-furcata BCC 54312 TaxID=1330021 RepID=A0A367LCH1_9HYPO|nr:hypothetical protein L249_0715 [Ophiocordyceps polyrhachis-furcata BCC 54312]
MTQGGGGRDACREQSTIYPSMNIRDLLQVLESLSSKLPPSHSLYTSYFLSSRNSPPFPFLYRGPKTSSAPVFLSSMAPFFIWALAALSGLGLGNENNDHRFQKELDQVLDQSRDLARHNPVCPRGRATLQVTPVKVVRKTPILVSAFFPRDTHVPIDQHHTLVVRNAPVHVYTIITRTRCSTTTCARFRGARQTGCNLNVVGVIPDPPRKTDKPKKDRCKAVKTNQKCLKVLPTQCSNLKNSNGSSLTEAIKTCKTALGGFGTGGLLSCLGVTVDASLSGQSIVTCLLGAISSTCISVLPATCLSLAGLVTITTAGAEACKTSLGPLGSDGADCFGSGKSGDQALLCLQIALDLVEGRDSKGNPCLVSSGLGVGGLIDEIVDDDAMNKGCCSSCSLCRGLLVVLVSPSSSFGFTIVAGSDLDTARQPKLFM